jgi:hypothetical protein
MNTLIIGFGKRAKYSILPALKIINEGKVYVYSRDLKKLQTQKEKYNIELFTSLEKESFKKISKIFICTPYESYLSIVQKLSKHDLNWVTLFVDTPIVPVISNIAIKQYKNKFKEILVTEDCFYNPINTVIKKIIYENKLGDIKKIIYNNFGHTYHALAQSRRLLKNKFIYCGIKNNNNFKFILSNSQININGTQSDSGYMHIFFKDSIISINDQNINNNANYKINYLLSDGFVCGYLINNRIVNLNYDLKKIFIKLNDLCKTYNIRDLFLQENIISLVYLISNAKINVKNKYLLSDGIYDSLVIAITRKLNLFFDIKFKKKSILIELCCRLCILKKNLFR